MKTMSETLNALKKSEKILDMFAQLCKSGEKCESKKTQMLVNSLILHIEENFFECNKENLQELVENYTKNSEQILILNKKHDGLNIYISNAIKFHIENK